MKEYRRRSDGTIVEYDERDLAEERRKNAEVAAKNEKTLKGCLAFAGGLLLAMFIIELIIEHWIIAILVAVVVLVLVVIVCIDLASDKGEGTQKKGKETQKQKKKGRKRKISRRGDL